MEAPTAQFLLSSRHLLNVYPRLTALTESSVILWIAEANLRTNDVDDTLNKNSSRYRSLLALDLTRRC